MPANLVIAHRLDGQFQRIQVGQSANVNTASGSEFYVPPGSGIDFNNFEQCIARVGR